MGLMMDSRTFYSTALKSGNSMQITVSTVAVRDLEINPGDQIEVTVRKTGKQGRRRPDAKFPEKTQKTVEEPKSEPVQYPEGKIDAETKSNFLNLLKRKGINETLDIATSQSEYKKEEFLSDPDIKKAIENG